ncbi:MAG: Zn-dependent hydrolase [Acidobacteria bacterium]|nr:MAG: Zn-dependent hydrolase [Acidobacteriota bacterium]PYR06578.1 MAG: Zn-dependent hydrolase [Acidobacteriota bacterium]
MNAQRVIDDLRELAARTSTADGAQRLAWGPVWREARDWFRGRIAELGLGVDTDSAGNNWVALPGASTKTVIVGSHLDSVPNGGWLDGCLGVMAALEALRMHAAAKPAVTLKLVDWADEEGARFGRSLLGSSAAAGSLDIDMVRELTDRQGTRLVDALAENGVSLERMRDAHRELKAIDARAYLELHIEQGPVLESMNKSTGVVLGTFGVERNTLRFTGQAAHSGSTPIPMRRDAFLAAAQTALECREIAKRHSRPGAGVVCTVGVVDVEPKIVTAVPGVCEISLDQRALDPDALAAMLRDAHAAADRAARDNNVAVEWRPLWRIDPRPFDTALVGLCEEAVREETGDAPRLPSGPLHDAAEMVPHMPVVMMFACSSNGLSHCKEEDTPIPHLEKTIRAYLRLVQKTVAHVANA